MWECNIIVFVLSSNRLLWNFYGLIIHQNTDSVQKQQSILQTNTQSRKFPKNSVIHIKNRGYIVWLMYKYDIYAYAFNSKEVMVFESLTHAYNVILHKMKVKHDINRRRIFFVLIYVHWNIYQPLQNKNVDNLNVSH